MLTRFPPSPGGPGVAQVPIHPPKRAHAIIAVALTLWLATPFAAPALAQAAQQASPAEQASTAEPPKSEPTAVDPVPAMADAAVRAWLQREPLALESLTTLEPSALCRMLPELVTNPAPPPGTQVRVEDRIERPSDVEGERRFTYAAVRTGGQLDVVEVVMTQSRGAWSAAHVGFLQQNQPVGVRAWLQTPAAAWVFAAFSLLVLLALMRRGSTLRRWLAAGLAAIREHRRLVVGTLVALYALFGLGAYVGTTLPQECEQAVFDVLNAAIGSVGATQAYGSGNVVRAAATTYFQNFVVVSTSVLLPLAALFALPAYLFAGLSFFAQGIPFGLLASGGLGYTVLLVLLLVLELTSYFLVVAGGGMFLTTLLRGRNVNAAADARRRRAPGDPASAGQGGAGAAPTGGGQRETVAGRTPPPAGPFARGFRKLLLMLPIAGLLLLAGAWYEALIIILGLA